MFFLPDLGIHVKENLFFARKHQGWSRLAQLPKLVLRSRPSLPRRSVSIGTQCLFHVITRPIRLVCKNPLFTLSGRTPARPFGLELALQESPLDSTTMNKYESSKNTPETSCIYVLYNSMFSLPSYWWIFSIGVCCVKVAKNSGIIRHVTN